MRRLILPATLVALVAAASPALAGKGLTGTYTGKLAATSAQLKPLNGAWKLAFAAGGKYSISRNGVVVIRGAAAFGSSGKITFGHESGPAACPVSEPGSYHYALSGRTLRFSLVKDACTGRLAVLTLVTYKRS